MIQKSELLADRILASETLRSFASSESLLTLKDRGESYSMRAFVLGTKNPEAPVFFLTGGVHGIEKIGAELCTDLLDFSLKKLSWDSTFQQLLGKIRVIFVPIVNPVGYARETRANGSGVDLMRNAPIDAEETVPLLLGGHRISNWLPWYRGKPGEIEPENQCLFELFRRECGQSRCVISLDIHSGFGFRDRLWFPHSVNSKPFAQLSQLYSFFELFEEIYPHHIYKIEPQSYGYLLHGDIWDHLFYTFQNSNPNVYLPLTLEMGSWLWIKKNPLQMISKRGLFNPIKLHRVRRTLRRHHLLFDFTLSALGSTERWATQESDKAQRCSRLALEQWYPNLI